MRTIKYKVEIWRSQTNRFLVLRELADFTHIYMSLFALVPVEIA